MASHKRGHGGRRAGAGRPAGSRMRRSEELVEKMIAAGKCPMEALIRLAEKAEAEGDISQAINGWKSILPYLYPKPKSVEIAPEALVELTHSLVKVRAQERHLNESSTGFGERLARAVQKLSEVQ